MINKKLQDNISNEMINKKLEDNINKKIQDEIISSNK